MNLNEGKNVEILPDSTIGILGSGQLGRMMAQSARQMGYRVHVYSPFHDSPAGQAADLEFQANYDDLESVAAFAKHVDVVTIESENIPSKTLDAAAMYAPAYPGPLALEICQNRKLEKRFLAENQIPTCKFEVVRSLPQLRNACKELLPAVLKTTTGGYDGKGQVVIRSESEIDSAWEQLNAPEAILEEWIDYDFEFSIVGVRNPAGVRSAFPSIRNEHKNGILDLSVSPSGVAPDVEAAAQAIAFEIMEKFDSVGVLTVEFFHRRGEVLVNEIAPRPHNSGHLTIEGHQTCQFEQHVRAICGLMPGSTHQMQPVAMANILGCLWSRGEPQWQKAVALPNTKLHLYGKGMPEPGRKMGHLTSLAESPEQACEWVRAARELLTPVAEPAASDKCETSADAVDLIQ